MGKPNRLVRLAGSAAVCGLLLAVGLVLHRPGPRLTLWGRTTAVSVTINSAASPAQISAVRVAVPKARVDVCDQACVFRSFSRMFAGTPFVGTFRPADMPTVLRVGAVPDQRAMESLRSQPGVGSVEYIRRVVLSIRADLVAPIVFLLALVVLVRELQRMGRRTAIAT